MNLDTILLRNLQEKSDKDFNQYLEIFLKIKKPWIGGNGDTVYLGIPADIVKQLQITENIHLMIDLIEDIIIIKKHNPRFTKQEIIKVQDYLDNTNEDKVHRNNFKNPLDRLDNI